MTSDVLSWDDSSNNKYIDSGVASFIINPISAYRTAQEINPKLADNIFVSDAAEGSGAATCSGACVELLRRSGTSPRTRTRRWNS